MTESSGEVRRREMRDFVVYGFESTHHALLAEAALQDAGVDVVPVPAPRTLGFACGIAMRVPPEQASRAEETLVATGLAWSSRGIIHDL